jgi:two-component system nitrogen regulation response regulator GlnG
MSETPSRVLIIDDEESICWGLKRLLEEAGHTVRAVASAEQGIETATTFQPDLVVLDVRLPGMDGLTAMEHIQEAAGAVPIIVITAFGNLDTAVNAMGGGAVDYLTKPFELERATAVIQRVLDGSRQHRRQHDVEVQTAGIAMELLGESAAMQEVFKRIALVAESDLPVLITGESGTGKELVARAIHRHSVRADRPFLSVNLASLSPTLIESELFGHVRGAFTGADDSRKGLLELGHQATVFFDEVGDIPPSVQVKLLRVLEQQEVVSVGDMQAKPCDFRVIAATNRNLPNEIVADRFRRDFYFRLAGFEIHLPPLRERVDDVPVLAEHFLNTGRVPRQPGTTLTAEAIKELQRRAWVGNVRELRSAVEHASLVARGLPITPEHLPQAQLAAVSGYEPSQMRQVVRMWALSKLDSQDPPRELYEQLLAEIEPVLFETVLAATSQNRAAAANILGIHRQTLRKKLSSSP